MKQIKDVEKLKDAIHAQCFQGADDGDNVAYKIESIIDSLAVEVPEAKSGAIDNALQEYCDALCIDVFSDKQREQAKKECDEAQAELAQLQAEREEAISIIKSFDSVKCELDSEECDKKIKDFLKRISPAIANPTEEQA